jgi:hypothetical protein
MKVKIFKTWDVTSQEREVNKWLEENKNVVIQHTLQSSAAIGSSVYTQITVFYSELAFEKVK